MADLQPHYLDSALLGRASKVRYAIGFVVAGLLFWAIGPAFGTLFVLVLGLDGHPGGWRELLGVTLTFSGALLALFAWVALMHRRGPRSLFGARRIAPRTFLLILAIVLVAPVPALALWAFGWPGHTELDWPPLSTWLAFFAFGAVGLAVQTTTEEAYFRGYLAQIVRRFTANRWWLIGFPAVWFTLPHAANIGGFSRSGSWELLLLVYLSSGLLFGWVAYETGSLWSSVILHFGSNWSIAIIAGTKGDAVPSGAPIQLVRIDEAFNAFLMTGLIGNLLIAVLMWLLVIRPGRAAGLMPVPAFGWPEPEPRLEPAPGRTD